MRLRTALIMSLLISSPTVFADSNAVTAYKGAKDSVVMLLALDSSGEGISIGTGFYVGDGSTVVTNFHVIQGASSIRLKNSSGIVSDISTVVAFDQLHDLAILKAVASGQPLSLKADEPQIGEEVYAIGNPKGLESTLSEGIVSGIRNEKDSRYYQVTAPISPGSSGGPILDRQGRVLGVATFQLVEGQNLNFAMPVAYVRDLLATPKLISLSDLPQGEPDPKAKVGEVMISAIADPDVYFDMTRRVTVSPDGEITLHMSVLTDSAEEILRGMGVPMKLNSDYDYLITVHPVMHVSGIRKSDVVRHGKPSDLFGETFYPVKASMADMADGFVFEVFDFGSYFDSGYEDEPGVIWSAFVLGPKEAVRNSRGAMFAEVLQYLGQSVSKTVVLTRPVAGMEKHAESRVPDEKFGTFEWFSNHDVQINELKIVNEKGRFTNYIRTRRYKSKRFDGYVLMRGLYEYQRLGKKVELEDSTLGMSAFSVFDNVLYVQDTPLDMKELDQRNAQRLFTLPLKLGDKATVEFMAPAKFRYEVMRFVPVKTPYSNYKDCVVIAVSLDDGVLIYPYNEATLCRGVGIVQIVEEGSVTGELIRLIRK